MCVIGGRQTIQRHEDSHLNSPSSKRNQRSAAIKCMRNSFHVPVAFIHLSIAGTWKVSLKTTADKFGVVGPTATFLGSFPILIQLIPPYAASSSPAVSFSLGMWHLNASIDNFRVICCMFSQSEIYFFGSPPLIGLEDDSDNYLASCPPSASLCCYP